MYDREWETDDWDQYRLWDQQVRPIATRLWAFMVLTALLGAAVITYVVLHAPASAKTACASAPGAV